ncbi:chalcone isomerase family protein [Ideonella paludis]|uniref:Chalcone isomerase family protein n=2 Tax=Ideonella paludis TaxID=1233411 RepID=A0ABS5DT07_9BURK|nr:chalcone isomerase family protein [Ideonella paludis]
MLGLMLSVMLGGLLLSPLSARAQDKAPAAPAEVRQLWPTPHLQGQARLRFIGLHIYDIRLWLQEPLRGGAWAQQPLALEIAYARNLDGLKIAERSLTEMQRGGPIDEATSARWLAEMKRLFPNVKGGDRITGVFQPGQAAAFLHNGRPLGEVRDARFAQAFFGIWLAPHSSEPQMREQLLGAP